MHHVSGREQAQEGKRPASAHQVGETARDRGTRAFGGGGGDIPGTQCIVILSILCHHPPRMMPAGSTEGWCVYVCEYVGVEVKGAFGSQHPHTTRGLRSMMGCTSV